MGGIVARLTPIRHPDTAKLIPNIITLATPHANPLYAFDESVHDIFLQLQRQPPPMEQGRYNNNNNNNNNQNLLVVSISGGLRDEMIEPSATDLGIGNNFVSVSSIYGDMFDCELILSKRTPYISFLKFLYKLTSNQICWDEYKRFFHRTYYCPEAPLEWITGLLYGVITSWIMFVR